MQRVPPPMTKVQGLSRRTERSAGRQVCRGTGSLATDSSRAVRPLSAASRNSSKFRFSSLRTGELHGIATDLQQVTFYFSRAEVRYLADIRSPVMGSRTPVNVGSSQASSRTTWGSSPAASAALVTSIDLLRFGRPLVVDDLPSWRRGVGSMFP